jgi:hypothetical protein
MGVRQWVYLGLALAIVAGVVTLYRHADGVGYTRAMGEVAARDNASLIKARDRIAELEKEKDDAEARHFAEIEAIDDAGWKEIKRVEAAKEKFIGDVVAGRLRLFQPGRHQPCPDGGERGPAAAAAAASVGDGAAGGELSGETALFLLGEAARADQVAVQLKACQKIVADDRS